MHPLNRPDRLLRLCRPLNSGGFTLIELLVVVAIIALLIGILLPSLAVARKVAATSVSLSNLRQLGIGLKQYNVTHKGWFPMHSSASSVVPRTRWADYIYPYMLNTEVYKSPLLEEDEKERMNKPFAHTVDPSTGAAIAHKTVYFGGYGYNFQYLGNARQPGGVATWHNNEAKIKTPGSMVAIGDVRGSKNGNPSNPYGINGEAVYSLDPPLGSASLGSNGSRKSAPTPGAGNAYYAGGSDGDENFRSMPGDRNHKNLINYTFADGHSESVTRDEIDDISDANPQGTNAYWNGQFSRDKR